MIDCERHKLMAELEKENLIKDQIYQKLRWIKCTCEPRRIWCDSCRGAATCLLCRNRNGEPRNKNYVYCPKCGGTGDCIECNGIGELNSVPRG